MHGKHRLLSFVLITMLLAGAMVTSIPAAHAGLGDILKGAGIVYLVDRFSDDLNNFINKLTVNKGVDVKEQTKVVPIISIGQSGYAGAAQVSGPKEQVDKVKAVAQIEAAMSGKTFRIKVLVPVESKDVVKNIKRVSGVGVSAVIDVKI